MRMTSFHSKRSAQQPRRYPRPDVTQPPSRCPPVLRHVSTYVARVFCHSVSTHHAAACMEKRTPWREPIGCDRKARPGVGNEHKVEHEYVMAGQCACRVGAPDVRALSPCNRGCLCVPRHAQRVPKPSAPQCSKLTSRRTTYPHEDGGGEGSGHTEVAVPSVTWRPKFSSHDQRESGGVGWVTRGAKQVSMWPQATRRCALWARHAFSSPWAGERGWASTARPTPLPVRYPACVVP